MDLTGYALDGDHVEDIGYVQVIGANSIACHVQQLINGIVWFEQVTPFTVFYTS